MVKVTRLRPAMESLSLVTFFSKKEAIWQFFCRHFGVVLCASSFKQDDKTSAAKQLTSTDRNPLFLIYTIVFSERGAKVDRYSSYTTGVRSKGQGSNPPDYGCAQRLTRHRHFRCPTIHPAPRPKHLVLPDRRPAWPLMRLILPDRHPAQRPKRVILPHNFPAQP